MAIQVNYFPTNEPFNDWGLNLVTTGRPEWRKDYRRGMTGDLFLLVNMNATAFTLNIGLATPYVQAGATIAGTAAATGQGTNWNYNFHWTTSAGGSGNINLNGNQPPSAEQISNNAIAEARANAQGDLNASTFFGTVGVSGDAASMSNSTFRLMSGVNGSFSPKVYNSGWNGGSPARITTYSLSKVGTRISTGASVVTTYMSYNQIYNGAAQPITFVDAGVGTAGILATGASYFYGVQIPVVGEFVAVYGALRLTWDVSFYLGTQYGPSKWYGTDENKWFK